MNRKGKILLMDDEEIILEVTKKMLAHLKYDVACARDGAEAVELYRKSMEENDPFSLVIMDLLVPGRMGAQDAMARLRELDPGVRAIVSSGIPTNDVMVNFRKYGFMAAMIKPFSFDELNAVLLQIFG